MRVETPETALFFAWQGESGKIDKQRGYKDDKAIFWYGKAKNNKLKADYVSVGKFKKGGAGKYRTLENLVSIDKCYSDIDSKYYLEWQELIARCNKYGIPKPNLIVRTPTPNHYQATWNIPEIDTDLLGLWQEVQEGIYELFKEFGADSQALDAIRYLRNPNKCEKAYDNELCRTSLSVLYRSLKMAGFIKDKPKPKWPTKFSPDGIPIRESKPKLESFLRDRQEYESTYADLSNTLSIPLRTVKYLVRQLKRDGRLETRLKGKAKTRKTVFILRSAYKEYLNTLHSKKDMDSGVTGEFSPETSLGKHKKESQFSFGQALELARSGGLSVGVRNFGIFGLALWLKNIKSLSYDDIHRELFSVLIRTGGLSRREFEKTLKSACRDKYRYCLSAKKFESVFVSLGLGGVH